MRAALAALVMALMMASAIGAAARADKPGVVTGSVVVKEKGLFGGLSAKKDRSGIVVYLERNIERNIEAKAEGPVAPPASNPVHSQIRQRDKQFTPRSIAVRVGTTVDFPNDDRIFHNVFSLSTGAKFDLGLYKSGTTKSITFDRPGQVDVYCNIHPEMISTIKVLDTPWFVMTGPDGQFRLAGVPPGVYSIVTWQARGEAWKGTVTVPAGGTAKVDIEVVEGREFVDHTRKDGSPYGRYE